MLSVPAIIMAFVFKSFCLIGATISFNQSLYSVVEDDVLLQGVLSFSNVATFDVNVEIKSIESSDAIGMQNYFSPYTSDVLYNVL